VRKDVPTVFIVDDDLSVCKALQRLIESVDMNAKIFTSPGEFLRFDRPDTPCCLLLDVRMPEMSGLVLQEQLAGSDSTLPIIFMTGFGDVPMSVRAMKAGAVDFLPKPFDDQTLLDAIHLAVDQDRRARQERAKIKEIQERLETLTPREHEVFVLVVKGMRNKQIAEKLGRSEKTIKVHRSRVMRKLQVKSLAELVQLAEKSKTDYPKG